MSVMFISDNHINLILNYVERCNNPYFQRYMRKELIKIGETIRDLNYQALENRYGENDENDEDIKEPFIFKITDFSQITNEFYFIKLLQFVKYQIDEANETTQKADLIETLEAWEGGAIANNQGYNDAPWGID